MPITSAPDQTRFLVILYALLAFCVLTFLFPQLSRILDNSWKYELGGSFRLWLTRLCSLVSIIVIIHIMRHPGAVFIR